MAGGRVSFLFARLGPRALRSLGIGRGRLVGCPESLAFRQTVFIRADQEASRAGRAGQNDESVQAGLSSVHRGGPDLFALFSERWLASKQACAFPERAYASPPLWH